MKKLQLSIALIFLLSLNIFAQDYFLVSFGLVKPISFSDYKMSGWGQELGFHYCKGIIKGLKIEAGLKAFHENREIELKADNHYLSQHERFDFYLPILVLYEFKKITIKSGICVDLFPLQTKSDREIEFNSVISYSATDMLRPFIDFKILKMYPIYNQNSINYGLITFGLMLKFPGNK